MQYAVESKFYVVLQTTILILQVLNYIPIVRVCACVCVCVCVCNLHYVLNMHMLKLQVHFVGIINTCLRHGKYEKL